MLRTDHCYPPTQHAPLDVPTVFDFHFEAITMPAPLPPTVEPLAPSRPTRCPHPEGCAADEVCIYRCVVHRLQDEATGVHVRTEPPRRVPWLACAIGAALFAVGYLLGRFLP